MMPLPPAGGGVLSAGRFQGLRGGVNSPIMRFTISVIGGAG